MCVGLHVDYLLFLSDFNQHHQWSQPIVAELPKTERFKICLAAASNSTWTDSQRETNRGEGHNVIYLTAPFCNFANVPESNPAESTINPLSTALQIVCVCVCVLADNLESCSAVYRHTFWQKLHPVPIKNEWRCNSTKPIHLHGTYRMNFTFTFNFPWPVWGLLHKLSLDTKLPIRTHSSSSPLQHVTLPWAFYKWWYCNTHLVTDGQAGATAIGRKRRGWRRCRQSSTYWLTTG
jgi:hypothetical protein